MSDTGYVDSLKHFCCTFSKQNRCKFPVLQPGKNCMTLAYFESFLHDRLPADRHYMGLINPRVGLG